MLKKLHTYKPGFLDSCQICGSKKLIDLFDFGFQPLADDLVSIKKKITETIFYPLNIKICNKCRLLQSGYIINDRKLYPKNYHYRPGITKEIVNNFKTLSKSILTLYGINTDNDLILDVGCNDGSLLKEFKKNGCKRNLGIEPTNTINFAKQKNISTLQNFFNIKTAKKAKNKFGCAKIIVTTNVFAHTNHLYDFIKGIKILLDRKGVFVIENHYLVDVIKKTQFDTFYHEHLRTYSLKSLITLMKYYDLNLIDAYTTSRYGGNIQAHFARFKKPYNSRIKKILDDENYYFNDEKIFNNFVKKIETSKFNLNKFLNYNSDKIIVGKAFPARASVLLHYFDGLKNNINYIYEQPTSKKLNFFAPGTNIKILSSNNMKKKEPDYVIILAWHLFDTIYKKWKRIFKKPVKFIKILPNFEIRK